MKYRTLAPSRSLLALPPQGISGEVDRQLQILKTRPSVMTELRMVCVIRKQKKRFANIQGKAFWCCQFFWCDVLAVGFHRKLTNYS